MANDEAAVSLVCESLENILKTCEEEIDTVNEYVLLENGDQVKQVEWSEVTAEDMIGDPQVQKALLPFLQRAIARLSSSDEAA